MGNNYYRFLAEDFYPNSFEPETYLESDHQITLEHARQGRFQKIDNWITQLGSYATDLKTARAEKGIARKADDYIEYLETVQSRFQKVAEENKQKYASFVSGFSERLKSGATPRDLKHEIKDTYNAEATVADNPQSPVDAYQMRSATLEQAVSQTQTQNLAVDERQKQDFEQRHHHALRR